MIDGTFDFLRKRLLRRGDRDTTGPLDFKTKFVSGTGPLADGAAAYGVGPLAAILVDPNVIGDAARAPEGRTSFVRDFSTPEYVVSSLQTGGATSGVFSAGLSAGVVFTPESDASFTQTGGTTSGVWRLLCRYVGRRSFTHPRI